MLKLWGRTNSLNVQKVLICLEEIGVSYERIDAGLHFGIVKSDAYKALNPNSVVPTLEDGDFVLWESNVIVRYLCSTYAADRFWPSETRRRARIEQWMDWQQTSANPPLTALFWGLVRAPGSSSQQDLEKAHQRAEIVFQILEQHLAEHAYISGDHLGMADFCLAPGVHRWLNLPLERTHRPRIETYLARIMQRTSVQKFLVLPLT